MTNRYKIEIEYNGVSFNGWQKQPQKEIVSIQGTIERAIFEFTGEKVDVYACGRTDAGVHAISMPAHIDLEKDWEEYKIVMACNALLRDKDVKITACKKMCSNLQIIDKSDTGQAPAKTQGGTIADWHARFSCKQRHYVYKVLNRPTPPALNKDFVWWVHNELNLKTMQDCAKLLEGTHDFSAFRGAGCQAKSPIKTMNSISVERAASDPNIIEFHLSAPSFIYHQVRNIVGTLVQAGKGKITVEQFAAILESCDRKAAGITAPASGLFFVRADY